VWTCFPLESRHPCPFLHPLGAGRHWGFPRHRRPPAAALQSPQCQSNVNLENGSQKPTTTESTENCTFWFLVENFLHALHLGFHEFCENSAHLCHPSTREPRLAPRAVDVPSLDPLRNAHKVKFAPVACSNCTTVHESVPFATRAEFLRLSVVVHGWDMSVCRELLEAPCRAHHKVLSTQLLQLHLYCVELS
jgi:hypothetical protein